MAQFDVQEITQQYFWRIRRAALILAGDPWDADDLTQETFLVFSRKWHSFRGRSSVYTWLYGILLNHDRSHRRRTSLRRDKMRALWNNEIQIERAMPGADSSLEAIEWKRTLWSRVAELPQNQRHALVLRFSEHLRYDEIAEVLQCPLGTVKSRIFHGLAALREKMQSDEFAPSLSMDHENKDIRHAI